ncbi:DUF4129 domain-containing protein [Noviluteimonas gilva]|uniref:DUF4129 domain-containing protein n=1 Tax=Noviluteimonas gilva TaxID=2682097 RepID=A0A7C9LHN3_9GAMM|nr:DUF4129 domain-containing protein [Lysobacter gilvus]MUV13259.1 DUF4129 domain-containing protein [Lysobacter gilvus]
MRIDQISVELRPRSSWEAVELGTALVRTHARAIWIPYVLLTLPVFVALCAVLLWLDQLQWVGIAYWWLKPIFDRVPLFVVSRAVFGAVPSVRETLAAQRTWGWRWMWHYLTWRRLSPYRALYMPVDLLEGGTQKRERRNVIGGSARGVAAWLTVAFVHFETAFLLGMIALVPMFMPVEAWGELAEQFGVSALLQSTWLQLAMASLYYIPSLLLEPFYIGAGFGLYLNRRTQLEAWDVELAFRRLRERLGGTLLIACIALGLAISPERPAMAAPAKRDAPTLPEALGDQYVAPSGFEKSVKAVKKDPLLHPVERRTMWVPRDKQRKKIDADASPIAMFIASVIGGIVKYALWIVAGLLIALLAWTFRTWWPWLRSMAPQHHAQPSAIDTAPIDHDEALPDDVPTAARALWTQGLARRALALLYRASVESMVARTGATLVPGATEAECLRASRAFNASEDRDAFARVVRTWQYAAYADRMPAHYEFESLLSLASTRFGWAA